MQVHTVVVGAGIAGAAAAYFLSERQRVVVLEREQAAGYHATGRSAAVFTENYGSDLVSGLVRASRSFLEAPPPSFTEQPILSDLGLLTLATADELLALESSWQAAKKRVREIERHDKAFALTKVPAIRPESVVECLWEPHARNIDVSSLLHGYLRGLSQRGGKLITSTSLIRGYRTGGGWRVETSTGEKFDCAVIVNAAGAWADDVANRCGLAGVRIQARRRTAVLLSLPGATPSVTWPMVSKVSGQLYFRPFGNQLLASPADQVPVVASDSRPEEIDVALTVARLEETTTLKFQRVQHSWSGLRSFTADEQPIVGWSGKERDFYWLAGQGGAGIKTSPALGMITAADIAGEEWPEVVRRERISKADLSPSRIEPPAIKR